MWWAEDFLFWKEQQSFFTEIARKHPGETKWHGVIAGLKGLIRVEQKRYRKIYGEKFDMNNLEKKILIEWIDNSNYVLNDWERKFFDHVSNKGYQLTKKESKKLVELYEKSGAV